MTRRDLVWRSLGVGLFAVAGVIGLQNRPGPGNVYGLVAFGLSIIAIVLVVQGRRVPAALRVERSRHRALAQAIHHARRRAGGAKP